MNRSFVMSPVIVVDSSGSVKPVVLAARYSYSLPAAASVAPETPR
jgi:hypothetical protein